MGCGCGVSVEWVGVGGVTWAQPKDDVCAASKMDPSLCVVAAAAAAVGLFAPALRPRLEPPSLPSTSLYLPQPPSTSLNLPQPPSNSLQLPPTRPHRPASAPAEQPPQRELLQPREAAERQEPAAKRPLHAHTHTCMHVSDRHAGKARGTHVTHTHAHDADGTRALSGRAGGLAGQSPSITVCTATTSLSPSRCRLQHYQPRALPKPGR